MNCVFATNLKCIFHFTKVASKMSAATSSVSHRLHDVVRCSRDFQTAWATPVNLQRNLRRNVIGLNNGRIKVSTGERVRGKKETYLLIPT